MISIARGLDEYDIAQEVRLSRQVHKGTFLLLEGQTDIDRFDNYTDNIECSPVNCYGKSNAIGAAQILSEEGFPGIVAVVDADFERINGPLPTHENIIYSATHDLDLDWLTTGNVLERYLRQVGDSNKIVALGGPPAVLRKIQEGLRLLSVLRWMNSCGVVRFKLDELRLDRFFSNFEIEIDDLISDVFFGRDPSNLQRVELAKKIQDNVSRPFDVMQVSNGHDVCTALGISLRSEIGARRPPQTWGSEVEIHVRLTFGDADFKSTLIFNSLISWEGDNKPYLVLDGRLSR